METLWIFQDPGWKDVVVLYSALWWCSKSRVVEKTSKTMDSDCSRQVYNFKKRIPKIRRSLQQICHRSTDITVRWYYREKIRIIFLLPRKKETVSNSSSCIKDVSSLKINQRSCSKLRIKWSMLKNFFLFLVLSSQVCKNNKEKSKKNKKGAFS